MNSYLETAIAIVLVIVIFSIAAYVFQELVASNLEFRGKMLKSSIKQLLDGGGSMANLTNQLYNHPQIKNIQEDLKRMPSYVPSANFAITLMDMVAKKAPTPTANLYADFQAGIATFASSNGDLKTWLENFSETSPGLKELKNNIESWYNEYMNRVTGWYKRKSTAVTRIIAIALVIGFNLNIITITIAIQNNSDLKARLVATANHVVENQQEIRPYFQENIKERLQQIDDSYAEKLKKDTSKKAEIEKSLEAARDTFFTNYTKNRLDEMNSLLKTADYNELPIGWGKATSSDFKGIKLFLTLAGWFMAAAAISMGAPFWFDMLVKLVNVRKAGLKPDDKK